MELYNRQLKNINYNTYKQFKKGVYNKGSDDILTFDIEVTSAWINEKGEIIKYEKGYSNDYWNSLTPLSLCYIWQFSFNDKVYYGRELRDFIKVLEDLDKNTHYIIWVHNLSYEFHFLCNILNWSEVFARSPHKPMKAIPCQYPNIEFRCSYVLTRLSLRSWGKEIGEYKDEAIDYEELRTPLTPLSEDLLHYAEQDCKVVYKGILKYREKYGHVSNIPLTQTGTVRREVKELLTNDPEYIHYIRGLIPTDADEYSMLIELFSGGYTHANKSYAGTVQRGIIEHYDFASSYPTVMVAEKYPIGKWLDITGSKFPSIKSFETYAYIFTLKFKNIRCETSNTYIQESKCNGTKIIKDNGRVLCADTLTMTMTEQDYLIIKDTYSWDKVEVIEMYKSHKDYLPKKFVDYVLDLYKNKTELKGLEGKEDIYQQSKQYINSLFGMCVTAIIQNDVQYDNGIWKMETLTKEYINEKLEELKKEYHNSSHYFLSYSWGIWITAYARRNLWKCILRCDTKVLYCDTDSIFVLGRHNFTWYNKEITKKLQKACEVQKLDFKKTRPLTIKGKEKPLGIFEKEEDCSEFISLGAKRYVERRVSDNKLHLTVSGINKEAVELLNNDISNFKENFDFDKDSPFVHKQLSIYNNNMPVVTYPDGYKSTYTMGITLRRTGYLLTMSSDYTKLIEIFNQNVGVLDEGGYIKLRKIFL